MAAKLFTLKTRADFLRIQKAHKACAKPGFILQMHERRGPIAAARPAGTIGVGWTASRKVGNAVARNRAKRRLRALAREVLPAQGQPGWDYVFIAWPQTRTVPWPQLIHDLQSCLAHQPRRRRDRAQQQAPSRPDKAEAHVAPQD